VNLRRTGQNVLLIFAAVSLMAAGEFIHALMMMNWQPGTTGAQLFVAQLASAACFGILIPLIAWWGRRYPPARDHWLNHVFPIALGGLLVCVIHPATYTALDLLIGAVLGPHYSFHYRYGFAFVAGQPDVPFWQVWWNVLTYYFTSLMFFYAGVIGFVSARQNFQLLRKSELDRIQLESGLAKARLNLLTMQLHPHFLFNTLNSISELMYDDVAAAERMIARLSELLRISLDRSDAALVPLGKELETLEIYLEIERIRFQDRLIVESEIAPDARSCLVPNLILQPLVENAVLHGISRLSGPGRVQIRARRTEEWLELEILNDCPAGTARTPPEGVGLRNTRDRMKSLYGDDCRIECGAAPDGRWRVGVAMPWSLVTDPELVSAPT
jgi:hypothetical protein